MTNTTTTSGKSREEILKEQQSIVAKKYLIGNKLVIGHRPVYFEEAALEAMKQAQEAAVDEALRVAKDIFDVPTETTADSNTSLFPTKQLKEKVLSNLK